MSRTLESPRTQASALPSSPEWLVLGVLAAYVAVIIWGSAHHEPWRDEVVAMSVARKSTSLWELWKFMRHEGHPILWYLCLRFGCFLLGSTIALPVLSILFATIAAAVLLRWCPLPLWFKTLFLFSYFPLFQYSVVWRCYGLAMMLFFIFCALYPERRSRPIAVGAVLALLANSTVFAMVISVAAGVMLVVDHFFDSRAAENSRRVFAGFAVQAAGIAHCVVEVLPEPSSYQMELYHHDAGGWMRGVVNAFAFPGADAGGFFQIPYLSLWLWLWFVTLFCSRRFALLAFLITSFAGFQTIYSLAYAPSAWHLGNVAIVVVGALWLGTPWSVAGSEEVPARWAPAINWSRRGLAIPLLVALAYQVIGGAFSIADEVRFDYSSSKRLAALIDADPRLDRAIVIGEPELFALALPYYRNNPIYLPQEKGFKDWLLVHTPGGRRRDYDLAELLSDAQGLRMQHQVPIVIVLWWNLDGPPEQVAFSGMFFEQRFTMTAAAREAFLTQTRLLGRLHNAVFTNENYDVFVLPVS